MSEPKLTCLFLTPLRGGSSQRMFSQLRDAIRYNLSRSPQQVELITLDSPFPMYGELVGSVSETIYRTLEKADLIIADITGSHPNIMYELGFAHALKKPVLPLVQKGTTGQIPSDLSGYLYFTYDPDEPGRLSSIVTEWIVRNQKSKEAV